jgi:hypothetical protein
MLSLAPPALHLMQWYCPQSVPLSLLSPTTRMLCLLLVTPLSLFRNSSDSNIPLIPYSTFGNYGMVWYHTLIFGHYGMVWYGMVSSSKCSDATSRDDLVVPGSRLLVLPAYDVRTRSMTIGGGEHAVQCAGYSPGTRSQRSARTPCGLFEFVRGAKRSRSAET